MSELNETYDLSFEEDRFYNSIQGKMFKKQQEHQLAKKKEMLAKRQKTRIIAKNKLAQGNALSLSSNYNTPEEFKKKPGGGPK